MGWGRARGKPAYGTAVGSFTSPDGVREGSGEASLRYCERERGREREREEGTWRGNTRTPAVGHHPRQGRGYQRTHSERTEMRERERERGERRKGRGVATHAPLPWDTTPGKDVVTSARTPERTEMRAREREREREGRDVAWQHTHPCRGTPPQARTWLPAHAPPKGQRGERERERERAREREKEGTWRGNTRTPAVGHHPRQGRGYQRTHPRKDRDETGWGRGDGSGEASLRRCGRNLYVSGWGGGGLEGKAAYGTAVRFFYISRKRMQAQEKNIEGGKTSNQHPHSSLAHHELNSVSRSNFK